jgi:hypothetical protein
MDKHELETLIDHNGIECVLTAISEIAELKADHIHSAWQDGGLARRWQVLAAALAETARKGRGL